LTGVPSGTHHGQSWNGGEAARNQFGFRFERVSVAHGRGGSLDRFHARLPLPRRQLSASRARVTLDGNRLSRRLEDEGGPLPYAFIASNI